MRISACSQTDITDLLNNGRENGVKRKSSQLDCGISLRTIFYRYMHHIIDLRVMIWAIPANSLAIHHLPEV